MNNILYVHGKGGHGRAVTAAALDLGWEVIQTDDREGTSPPDGCKSILAIGDNAVRKNLDRIGMVSIVHPTVFASQGSQVNRGSYVGPRATIISGTRIHRGCIINTGAIVEHDCSIGRWCHVAPGATLCGTVTLGEGCFVGANATIREGVTVAPWVTIGCGSVVISNISEAGVYVGSPVRKIK